ncbi:MAG TPA: hypothetical protein VJ901_18935 [Thermoanaerobaculia bacterium]|nr:hypothetical protein [Thermoanaerobaculia bacterium]
MMARYTSSWNCAQPAVATEQRAIRHLAESPHARGDASWPYRQHVAVTGLLDLETVSGLIPLTTAGIVSYLSIADVRELPFFTTVESLNQDLTVHSDYAAPESPVIALQHWPKFSPPIARALLEKHAPVSVLVSGDLIQITWSQSAQNPQINPLDLFECDFGVTNIAAYGSAAGTILNRRHALFSWMQGASEWPDALRDRAFRTMAHVLTTTTFDDQDRYDDLMASLPPERRGPALTFDEDLVISAVPEAAE